MCGGLAVQRAEAADRRGGVQNGVARAVSVPLVRRGRGGVVGHRFLEVEDAADIVDAVAQRTDGLQFLAELMLPEAGQRIAAEAAVRTDDRRTVGAGDVIVLFDVQIAVGRDRANFQRVGRAIRQVQIHAARIVDAKLLRHADVGLRHAIGALDLH